MRGAALALVLALAATSLSACAGGSNTLNAIVPDVANNLRNAPRGTIPHDLYIADISLNAVFILHNTSYRDVGMITNGLSAPIDVFLDRRGDLYAANSGNATVTEYAPGETSEPKFTYSASMSEPLAVTTDAHANVFEADVDGNVNEYFQGFDHVNAACDTGGIVNGVAVDSSGDVFVNVFILPSGPEQLAEYPGGLGNCAGETILGALLNDSAAGIAIDANKNLLVTETNQVLVIDPPYSSVTGTIGSGFGSAVDVRLNKQNTLAFVTDQQNDTVTVVSYPAGTNLTVLGAQNGLYHPHAAVDWANAVY